MLILIRASSMVLHRPYKNDIYIAHSVPSTVTCKTTFRGLLIVYCLGLGLFLISMSAAPPLYQLFKVNGKRSIKKLWLRAISLCVYRICGKNLELIDNDVIT